jgi:hypothetical protein
MPDLLLYIIRELQVCVAVVQQACMSVVLQCTVTNRNGGGVASSHTVSVSTS